MRHLRFNSVDYSMRVVAAVKYIHGEPLRIPGALAKPTSTRNCLRIEFLANRCNHRTYKILPAKTSAISHSSRLRLSRVFPDCASGAGLSLPAAAEPAPSGSVFLLR